MTQLWAPARTHFRRARIACQGAARPDGHGRLDDFVSMKLEIDAIKRDAAAARIEQMSGDLALLKAQDGTRYERLRTSLLAALER
jgi:hypothetical protein